MRLATLAMEGTTRAVVIDGTRAFPVGDFLDVGALLRAGDAGSAAAAAARTSGDGETFSKEDLRRPVLEPGAIVCVGLNYRDHILEMGRELPTAPTLFGKLARALTDPYADIAMPAVSDKLDYEAELAIVIGKPGRDVDPAAAWEHVAGLTVLNDVTARDLQRRSVQWFAGKTLAASTPVGPVVVTPDELGPLDQLTISLTVNGEERQRSRLGELVFDVPALVADLSRLVDLRPGDLIATGTPGGVGDAAGRFLADVTVDGQ